MPFVIFLRGITQRVNPPAPVMGSAAQSRTFPAENALVNVEEEEVIHKSVIKGKLKTESTAEPKQYFTTKKRVKKKDKEKIEGIFAYSNY